MNAMKGSRPARIFAAAAMVSASDSASVATADTAE